MKWTTRRDPQVAGLWFCVLLASCLSVRSTALCAGEKASDKTFVYGELFRPVVFCSLAAKRNMCEIRASALLYPSLLRRKTPHKAEFEGWLANELPVVGGGLNEKVFKLNRNAQWVDRQGAALWGSHGVLCASDVVRTLDAMAHDDTRPKSPFVIQLGNAEKPKTEEGQQERHKVKVRLKFLRKAEKEEPYDLFTFPVLPFRLVGLAHIDRAQTEMRRPSLFIGPYLLQPEDDRTKTEIVFRANASYFEGPPKIKRIVLRTNNDPTVLHELMRDRVIHALPEVKPSDIDNLQRHVYITLKNYNSYSYYFLGFNLDRRAVVDKKLRDNIFVSRKLRRALAICMDRERIVDQVYGGNARLMSGPFPPNSVGDSGFSAGMAGMARGEYQGQLKDERWEAAKILKEFKREHGGEKVILAFKQVAHTDDAFAACREIQSQLQGMLVNEVKLLQLDEDKWDQEVFQKASDQRAFHIALERFSMGWDLDISPLFETGGECNFMHFSDAYVDAMLGMSRRADYNSWADICRILHQLIAKECPAIFCWQLKSYAAYNSEEFKCTIDPFNFFFKVHQWEPL